MLEKLLVREAKKRAEYFRNLPSYLERMKRILRKHDRDCRIYIFGSVAKNDSCLLSDIDILVKTRLKPNFVIALLRDSGFDEPFEFHIVNEEEFKLYRKLIGTMREI